MSQIVVAAHHVSKVLGEHTSGHLVLDDVSLTLRHGERVALVGPSGSGKSTLLQILGALDTAYRGRVEVLGRELKSLTDAKLAGLRNEMFGFVFQAYNLLPHLSVLQNVLLPAYFGPTVPDAARAEALLARVGLQDKGGRRPRALSGGERQRVAIARAMYNKPKVLLCDEPTGNLDKKTAYGILDLFDALAREGVSLLFATHDADIAQRADRVVHLENGRLT